MTNAINLAALGQGGIDMSGLVTSLVSIEQQPMNQVTTEQQNAQAAQMTLSSFSASLSALKNAAAALSSPAGFSSMKATSSDPSIVATATGTAPGGQWSVSVSAIAQEQRTLSNGIALSTTALGLSGNLGIAIGGGASTPISISSTDTLSSIAGKIASSGLAVQASLVYDGSKYHLLVAGRNTGQANAITFDESGLTSSGYSLGLSTPANQIQTAQDASLNVGAVAGIGGIAITSPTNQIANAIPGVTFAITKPTTGAATLTIAGDPSGVTQNVQAFVTAYNAVVTGGHNAAGFGTQVANTQLLQGDQGIRSSLDQLGLLMGEQVPGTSGVYTTLASAGVNLNTDGTLSLNSTTLAAALTADPASVARLFVTDASNGSQGVMGTLGSAIDSLTTGASAPLQAEQDGFANRIKDLVDTLGRMQLQSTAYETQLKATFAQMNATLALYKNIGAQVNAALNPGTTSGSTNTVL